MLEKSISTGPLDWVAPIRSVRKNRSIEEKRKIVLESLSGSTSIAAVARTHNINPNLLHTWRWQYRRGELGGSDSSLNLIPVKVASQSSMMANQIDVPASCTQGYIEIIVDQVKVLIHGSVKVDTLQTVLAVLRS